MSMLIAARIRNAFPLAAFVLLSGCPPEQHDVQSDMNQGQVMFQTNGHVGFWNRTPCLSTFRIEDEMQQVVWQIDRMGVNDCEQQSEFPIRYGILPRGFRETRPAAKLQASAIYVIIGGDLRTGANYVGGFRIHQGYLRLTSFQWNDPTLQNLFRAQMQAAAHGN